MAPASFAETDGYGNFIRIAEPEQYFLPEDYIDRSAVAPDSIPLQTKFFSEKVFMKTPSTGKSFFSTFNLRRYNRYRYSV